MKKLLTILLIAFSITSYAQTKLETVAWIKEKIGIYGESSESSSDRSLYFKYNIYIEGDSLFFERKMFPTKRFIPQSFQLFSLNLNDIIKVEDNFLYTDGYKIRELLTKKGQRQRDEDYGPRYQSNLNKIYFLYGLDKEGEPDLINRMIKAFTKLAEYNAADLPKEAF